MTLRRNFTKGIVLAAMGLGACGGAATTTPATTNRATVATSGGSTTDRRAQLRGRWRFDPEYSFDRCLAVRAPDCRDAATMSAEAVRARREGWVVEARREMGDAVLAFANDRLTHEDGTHGSGHPYTATVEGSVVTVHIPHDGRVETVAFEFPDATHICNVARGNEDQICYARIP